MQTLMVLLAASPLLSSAFCPPRRPATQLHRTNELPPRQVAVTLFKKDDGEEGLGDIAKKYGVIALLFHFSVWICTLSASVAALNVYDPVVLLDALPEALRSHMPQSSAAATFPIALALCEVIGPVRLALTVAATPAVAATLRGNARFVEVEGSVNARLGRGITEARKALPEELRALLPGGDE